MKKIYIIAVMLLNMVAFAQSETEVTNLLNNVCLDADCNPIQLGYCPGDLDSTGQEVQFTDFEVYYVTQNILLNSPGLILRNCRLEFRNGANLVDNDWFVDEQTDCDMEFQTQLVFVDGGQRFSSVEDMNQTLGITETKINNEKLNLLNLDQLASGKRFDLFNYMGQNVFSSRINVNTVDDLKQRFQGLYLMRVEGFNKTLDFVN